jgi:hypothetical protein
MCVKTQHWSGLDVDPACFLEFHQSHHRRDRASHLVDEVSPGDVHCLYGIGAGRITDAVQAVEPFQFLPELRALLHEESQPGSMHYQFDRDVIPAQFLLEMLGVTQCAFLNLSVDRV